MGITLFQWIVLSGVLFLAWTLWKRAKTEETSARTRDKYRTLSNLKISEARVEDIVCVSLYADRSLEQSFTVQTLDRIEMLEGDRLDISGKDSQDTPCSVSSELNGMFLTWKCHLTASESVTLERLGLSEEKLIDIDEKQPHDLVACTYQNDSFYYHSSEEAKVYRDGRGLHPEIVYMWRFKNAEFKKIIEIEKRRNRSFECALRQVISPHDVMVYRTFRKTTSAA